MKNKKTILCLSAFLCFSTHANIIRIYPDSDEAFSKIEQLSALFAITSFSIQKGPDISRLKTRAATFFAKYDLFGFAKYFEFETQNDADALQLGCYNGGALSVKWFYIPLT